MAYCPLAHGSAALLADPTLQRLARARSQEATRIGGTEGGARSGGGGCTPAQLALRWSIDSGFVPIPKARSPQRLAENWEAAVAMAPLSAEERASLDALDADDRYSFNPWFIA